MCSVLHARAFSHTQFHDFVLHNNPPFVQVLAFLFLLELADWMEVTKPSFIAVCDCQAIQQALKNTISWTQYMRIGAFMQCTIPTTSIIICASLKHCFVLGMLFRYNNRLWYLPESLPLCFSMQAMCMLRNNAIHFTPHLLLRLKSSCPMLKIILLLPQTPLPPTSLKTSAKTPPHLKQPMSTKTLVTPPKKSIRLLTIPS